MANETSGCWNNYDNVLSELRTAVMQVEFPSAEELRSSRKNFQAGATQTNRLERVLAEVYPNFDLDLRNSHVVVDNRPAEEIKRDTSKGSVEFSYNPRIFDSKDSKHLDGLTFRIPRDMTQDPELARAYFAHECSHLEFLKEPLHVGYYVALSAAHRLISPVLDIVYGDKETPKTKVGKALGLLNAFMRIAAFVPLKAYINIIERTVDRNAGAKGYHHEIKKSRREFPL